MKKIEMTVSIFMLVFSICFNLWLYRTEPTAQVDPNDNAFQYGLVDRTNQIWDWAGEYCKERNKTVIPVLRSLGEGRCHVSLLIDHWVPNWAQGYNLPYYYSHVPQIVIVGSYRFLSGLSQFLISNFKFLINFKFQILNFKLFEYYHWIIYLLLCFFPLSVFLSLRVLRLPWLVAGIGALLASHISTDGLYGMDPPSFLWRGWGLSSQLFAMMWMPLALAFSIRWITECNAIGKQFFEELKICLSKHVWKSHTANLHLAREKVLQNSDVRNRASLKNSFPDRGYSDFTYAILFITLTTMGHLGLGLMLFLAVPVIAFTRPLLSLLNQESIKQVCQEAKAAFWKTVLLALPPVCILSYWIVPTLLGDAFHNVSFWDPVWKFNSYGAIEVLVSLWNGFLFDWGRLPIFTLLVFFGLVIAVSGKKSDKECGERTKFCAASLPLKDGADGEETIGTEDASKFSFATKAFRYPELSFLFLFFLLLYFGKTTWGGMLDVIPGMSQFHQHRFIVGLHLIGLFLAPLGITYAANSITLILHKFLIKISNPIKSGSNFKFQILYLCIFISLSLYICYLLYPQTISYAKHNETLIVQANGNFTKQKADAELLVTTLKDLTKEKPGRVYAGRGGTWGKDFQIAETAYFMYLSTYGIPTVLWLPETWSNNSDTEQYFSEDVPDHYALYNIRYVVAPPSQQTQPFWKLLRETASWKLYEVTDREQTSGYITAGVSPSVVFSGKLSFANVVRLWIQSPYPAKGIFPELTLTNAPYKKSASKGSAFRSYFSDTLVLPHFAMTDEATYRTPDGVSHSLFAQPPVYMTPWEWPEALNEVTRNGLRVTGEKNNQEPPRTPQPATIPVSVTSQSSDADMVFKATVEVKEVCQTCVVILRQTYHPGWIVTINGKRVKSINVFPSYVAVRLEKPGTYEVVFSYTPSHLKMALLYGALLAATAACVIAWRYRRKQVRI